MVNEEFKKAVIDAIRIAETRLPKDVVKALEEGQAREDSEVAKAQLGAILKNVKIARDGSVPMCQDTGIQSFFIEVGADFPFLKDLKEAIMEGVKSATPDIPIRPNTVDPFTGKNHGDNTGKYIPYLTWEVVEGNEATITAFPKGGGSENMSALFMLKPGMGIKGVKDTVVKHVIGTGGNPCPPTVIGVGIGGGADLSLKLGKKALLRPVGVRHSEPEIAKLEQELLDAINASGVGPQGLGGKTTAMDLHIEYAHRHPASLPVGIVVQCWANRRAKIKIDASGKVEVN